MTVWQQKDRDKNRSSSWLGSKSEFLVVAGRTLPPLKGQKIQHQSNQEQWLLVTRLQLAVTGHHDEMLPRFQDRGYFII